MENTIKVSKIRNGTVIDHIAAGKALDVLSALKLQDGAGVIIAMNLASTRMGKKDILKIDNKQLEKEEYDQVALISPDATVVSIRDFQVASKQKVEIPQTIKSIISCINPKCITNSESYVASEFRVVSKNPAVLRCVYCEHEIVPSEIRQ